MLPDFLITLDKELIARQNFIFYLNNCWLAIEDTVLFFFFMFLSRRKLCSSCYIINNKTHNK